MPHVNSKGNRQFNDLAHFLPNHFGHLVPLANGGFEQEFVDGGFRLDWVQPVDQFRWSSHVELAAAFVRR